MSYRPDREKAGFCKIWMRGNTGSCYIMDPRYYGDLVHAWRGVTNAAPPFRQVFDGADLYGDPVLMDLGNVEAVALCSADGIESYDRDEAMREILEDPTE